MHFGVVAILVGMVAVLAGSLAQGSIGFGLNTLSAPFIALVAPQVLPVAIVLAAIPSVIAILAREHHALDRPLLGWMLLGALPGTLAGLAILSAVDPHGVSTIVGIITLTSVALSVLRLRVHVKPTTAVAAGLTSNTFGTAAGVGGPPVSLLLQYHRGPETRATLSAFFLVSAIASIIGYAATGEIHGFQVVYALILLPPIALGVWASKHLHAQVDGGWLRPAVLVISAIAGLAALINGLT